MAPSVFTDLSSSHRNHLLAIARDAIEMGIHRGRRPDLELSDLPDCLLERRGVFVTLNIESRLRGCIGHMTANDTLAHTVADAAFGAAFRDPRFPALIAGELPQTRIEISILSPTRPVVAADRKALLKRITPGVDGLLLVEGRRRATFLPKVWEQLPEPERFLDQLFMKAGLKRDHWSNDLRFERYSTICFAEPL